MMATTNYFGEPEHIIDDSVQHLSEDVEGVTDDELDIIMSRIENREFYGGLLDNSMIRKRLLSKKLGVIENTDYDEILRPWYGTANKPRWCPQQSKFGSRGGRHKGVDVAAEKGTRFLSLVDGYLEWKPNGGNIGHRVWINFRYNGSNYTLIYGHLDNKIGKAPRSVKAGDEVAISGCTGNTIYCPSMNCAWGREDHVHVKLVGASGPLDPVPFIGWKLLHYDDVRCVYVRCQ